MARTRGDADTDSPRPPTEWSRVADGIGMAGLGVFFLVATTRGLPDGFWIEAVSFWPVLLVSAGIRIVFEKTSFPAGMVLGPTVVLATLFWLAWGDRPAVPPPGEWQALSAGPPEGAESARFKAEFAGVHLGLETRSLGPALLAEGRAASRESTPRLEVEAGDGTAEVQLRGRRGGFMMIGTRREVWELGVTDALPLEFDLNGALIRGDLDLRRGVVTNFEANGAFNSWILHLPPTSQRVKIRFEGAFSTIDVKVPEGTPVRYDGPDLPIVWLDRGPATDSLAEDEPGYEIALDGAFSVVNIEEGPPPAGGWPAPRAPREARSEEEKGPPLLEDPSGGTYPPAEAPPE